MSKLANFISSQWLGVATLLVAIPVAENIKTKVSNAYLIKL